jgi:hypothetical protein
VDISTALAADLALLTQALDQPDIDLKTQVQTLAADVASAVSSYLGLRMNIAASGHVISFALAADTPLDDQVAASLLIPLDALIDIAQGSALVLYAAAPGAFVDLAADLAYALDLDPARLVLDEHLDTERAGANLTGLDRYSAINQAIGILIERGHTPGTALTELQRLASLDGNNLHHAAATIVLGVSAPSRVFDED